MPKNKSKKKRPSLRLTNKKIRERRRAQRLDIKFKIKYKLMPRKKILEETISQNVSGGGFCVHLNQPLKNGSKLKVLLYMPNVKQPITALSKVVWCRKSAKQKGYDVGIKHVKIAPKDKERFVFSFCEMMINYFMGI